MVGELFAILRIEFAMGESLGSRYLYSRKLFYNFRAEFGGIFPETRLVALMDKQAFTEMVMDD